MICDFALTVCMPAWLNNCVGHHNHRHFFLFCVYMCIGCFYVSISGYPLFKEHFYGVQVLFGSAVNSVVTVSITFNALYATCTVFFVLFCFC